MDTTIASFATEGTKYHPLFEHLLYSGHGQTTMSFVQIEGVIEARLPPSAYSRQEWWSNSTNGHSQARAWLRASYLTSAVDLNARKVTFTLEGWPAGYVRPNVFQQDNTKLGGGMAEPSQAPLVRADHDATAVTERDHPLFGIWKGRVTLVEGYDYAKPVFDADGSSGDQASA